MLEKAVFLTILLGFLISVILSPFVIPFLKKIEIRTKHPGRRAEITPKKIGHAHHGRDW